MFYVSRYTMRREGRKHRKVFDVYVGDTENDYEELFPADELWLLLDYGLEIHGLCVEQKERARTMVISTYTPTTGANAKSKLLYGFSCNAIDGVLKYLAPDSTVKKESDPPVTVVLSSLCSDIGDNAISKSCTLYKIKFVFDDKLTFSRDIFKDLYKQNINWERLTFDIHGLSEDKATSFYWQVGFKVQECNIIDKPSRKYNLIGRQCYLHCLVPHDPRAYICNRKIVQDEFYNLYKGVEKGVKPLKGYSSRTSLYDRERCWRHFNDMIESYEKTGTYESEVSMLYLWPALSGVTATAKLLESYVTSRGNDPVLLEAYYNWVKESLKVL